MIYFQGIFKLNITTSQPSFKSPWELPLPKPILFHIASNIHPDSSIQQVQEEEKARRNRQLLKKSNSSSVSLFAKGEAS